MTTEADPNEGNPYRSPTAPCDAIERPLIVASGLIRWRVIPVCVLYLCGAFLVVGGITVLGIGLWRLDRGRVSIREIGSSIMVLPGCLFVYAGRSLWRGSILRGILFALLAVAAYLGCAVLLEHFGWQ